MRLLLHSSEFPPGPGGIGTNAFQLARQFALGGWEVHVVSRQDYASADEIARFNSAQQFTVHTLRAVAGPPLEMAYRWRTVRRLAGGLRPTCILATGSRAVLLTALMRSHLDCPMVAIGHGTEFGRRTWMEGVQTRWAFNRADTVVCVSEFTRATAVDAGVRHGRTIVIPNGADDSRFRPLSEPEVRAARRRLDLTDEPVILTLGNLTRRKGQDIVIRAMPRVLQSVPRAHYLAVGLPTLQRELADLARSLGVAAHVRFPGKVDEPSVAALLGSCDVFVMTSRHVDGDFEGYGIAVVEAALCGKPAVVSGASGLREAIEDGVTGLAVPPDDPDATADAIVRLLRNGDLRERFGRAARARALAEQTWTHRASTYRQLLGELTACHRGAA